MWDLLGPGIEPMFLALVGRFIITEPPGKPRGKILKCDDSRTEMGLFRKEYRIYWAS